MSVRNFLASGAAACILAVAVSACAGTPGERGELATTPQGSKDVAQWSMPLDSYLEVAQSAVPREAWLVSMSSCMTGAGFPGPEVPVGFAAPVDPTRNIVGYKLFDREIAEKYGYHDASMLPEFAYVDPGDSFGVLIQQFGEPAQAAFDSCSAEFDGLLASDASSDDKSSMWLSVEAAHQVESSGALADVRGAWRKCMEPQGVPGLSDGPEDFPLIAMTESGLDLSGDGVARSAPTPREIELAIADAECRDSSGYSQKRYDLEWEAESKLLDANRAHLEEERAKNQAKIDEATAVLAEER